MRVLAALLVVAVLLAGCADVDVDLARVKRAITGEPQHVYASPIANGTLAVHFVNVGQGDGAIWRLPDGSFVVYDCGPAASSPEKNAMVLALRGLGLASGGTIRTLIASHGHLDHVGGCQEVFSEYRVEDVYEAWYEGSDAPKSYAAFLAQAKAEGARIHTMHEVASLEGELVQKAGDDMGFPGVRAEILAPLAFAPQSWDDIAHASLVVQLTFGAERFCFQGDVEGKDEAALGAARPDVRCDVYLVGHHGSAYASSAQWLAQIKPSLAVVSFGVNDYGHPDPDTLCRVQQAGAKVYATHRNGMVNVTTDGKSLAISGVAETIDYCAPGASYWSSA